MTLATTTSHPRTVKAGTISVLAMTAAILLMVCANVTPAYAQDRVVVEPDDFPASIGALNRAIEENGGDVVYVLQNGATYFLETILRYDHPVRIEAEEYPSDNPPIVRPGTDLEGNSLAIARFIDDAESYGIFYFAIDDLGTRRHNQRPGGDGKVYHWEHCYFAGSQNYIFRTEGAGNTLRILDSQVRNMGRASSLFNSRFFDPRGNDQDSLIIRNTSIYNVAFTIIQMDGGGLIGHLEMDHVTVVNQGTFTGLPFGLARDVRITNSLFRNVGILGDFESAELVGDDWPNYDGPRYFTSAGFMSVESYEDVGDFDIGTDADRSIIIRNNNFGGLPDQDVIDFWAEINEDEPWETDPEWQWNNPNVDSEDPEWADRDTIRVVRIAKASLDSTLTAWADQDVDWVTIENNIQEEVAFDDPPQGIAAYVRAFWFGEPTAEQRLHDRRADLDEDPNTRYYHPADGSPTDPEGNTAAWFRDLGYSTASVSYSHGESGFPVGNLNYFPEMREAWGSGEGPVSAESEGAVPDGFRLVGNYPNPFNPTTNIVYELSSPVDVTLKVYNVLGRKVADVDLGVQNPGRHEVSFDATTHPSGVYMVRMSMGDNVQSHVITLTK